MKVRRALGVIAMLVATLAVLDPPAVEAGKRCRTDRQCKGGECNDAGRCCNRLAGEVACGASCCDTLVEGMTCCENASCVDLQNDDANCGACGSPCVWPQHCEQGSCVCPSGMTVCNGECVLLDDDSQNCGACGNECTGGRFCLDAECVCPDGWSFCGDACVDTQTDPNNCGACGNACPSGQECVAGVCESDCPAGQTLCNGQCVSGEGACCEWQGSWHVCPSESQCAGVTCCGPGYFFCGDGNNPQCCLSGVAVCQADRCCIPDGVSGCPCPPGEVCTGCCSYGQ